MGQSGVFRSLAIGGLAALTIGCSTHQAYYAAVAEANAQASAAAEARYAALAQLAETGDDMTRMAAAMALAMSGGPELVQPQQSRPIWLDVLSVTAGPIAMLGTTAINASVSRQQIRSNEAVSISTNESFVGLGTAGIDGVATVGAAGADATARTAQSGLLTIERLTGGE